MVLGPGGGGTGGWSPDGPGWGEAGYSFGGGVKVTSKFVIFDGLGLGEYGGVLGVGVWKKTSLILEVWDALGLGLGVVLAVGVW